VSGVWTFCGARGGRASAYSVAHALSVPGCPLGRTLMSTLFLGGAGFHPAAGFQPACTGIPACVGTGFSLLMPGQPALSRLGTGFILSAAPFLICPSPPHRVNLYPIGPCHFPLATNSAPTKSSPSSERAGVPSGSGEVYRARDPRLNRDVAIKVSQERFSDRFEREARAVAALNHPTSARSTTSALTTS